MQVVLAPGEPGEVKLSLTEGAGLLEAQPVGLGGRDRPRVADRAGGARPSATTGALVEILGRTPCRSRSTHEPR